MPTPNVNMLPSMAKSAWQLKPNEQSHPGEIILDHPKESLRTRDDKSRGQNVPSLERTQGQGTRLTLEVEKPRKWVTFSSTCRKNQLPNILSLVQ